MPFCADCGAEVLSKFCPQCGRPSSPKLAVTTQGEVTAVIPGHGTAAPNPAEMVSLTRDYLAYVREQMKLAVDDWIPFDEAYQATDWSAFSEYPAFAEANRRNSYGVYLSLEQESIAAQ